MSGFDSDFENELNMKVCDFYDVFHYTMYVINWHLFVLLIFSRATPAPCCTASTDPDSLLWHVGLLVHPQIRLLLLVYIIV